MQVMVTEKSVVFYHLFTWSVADNKVRIERGPLWL